MKIFYLIFLKSYFRDAEQESALTDVKLKIEQLVLAIQSENPNDAKKLLDSYISCCSPEEGGSPDSKFEKLLLSCASDDQKAIAKRLQTIKIQTQFLSGVEQEPGEQIEHSNDSQTKVSEHLPPQASPK